MRNLNLKQWYPNIKDMKIPRKHQSIIDNQGKYNILIENECPIDKEWLIKHMELKPKSFSFYKWVFPALIAKNYHTETYIKAKNWYDNRLKEVEVEITGKLQALTLCFDSPHFTSCGAQTDVCHGIAYNKILNPFVFAVIKRDRRGLIEARQMAMVHKDCIKIYRFYGNDIYRSSMISLLKTKFGETKSIIEVGSFI